jgi:uncharacterized membrane protein
MIGIFALGLFSFLRILTKLTKEQTQAKETIRLRLARGMLLALDFEVGSDILKTILVPSFNELAILAVIVSIRMVLRWSLSKEIVILKSLGLLFCSTFFDRCMICMTTFKSKSTCLSLDIA